MNISLVSPPVDALQGDVFLTFVYRDRPVPQGHLGTIDWYLDGMISRLTATQRFQGQWGEALLVAGGVKVRCDKILAVGVGDQATFSIANLPRAASCAVEILNNLKASRIVVELPAALGSLSQPAEVQRHVVSRLVKEFLERETTTLPEALLLLPSPPPTADVPPGSIS